MAVKKQDNRKKEIIKKVEENPHAKEVIKNCVRMYYDVLEYVDSQIFEDVSFCEELLFINGMTLQYMPEEIKKNKYFAKIAISRSGGFALKFADDSLRADYEIVKLAILRHKKPLIYASEDLQIFFMEKWNKYYEKHPSPYWKGHKMVYNGIRTPKEEMEKIYEEEKNKNKKKDKKSNKSYEELKELLKEEQIEFSEYDFEEKDED